MPSLSTYSLVSRPDSDLNWPASRPSRSPRVSLALACSSYLYPRSITHTCNTHNKSLSNIPPSLPKLIHQDEHPDRDCLCPDLRSTS